MGEASVMLQDYLDPQKAAVVATLAAALGLAWKNNKKPSLTDIEVCCVQLFTRERIAEAYRLNTKEEIHTDLRRKRRLDC